MNRGLWRPTLAVNSAGQLAVNSGPPGSGFGENWCSVELWGTPQFCVPEGCWRMGIGALAHCFNHNTATLDRPSPKDENRPIQCGAATPRSLSALSPFSSKVAQCRHTFGRAFRSKVSSARPTTTRRPIRAQARGVNHVTLLGSLRRSSSPNPCAGDPLCALSFRVCASCRGRGSALDGINLSTGVSEGRTRWSCAELGSKPSRTSSFLV